MQQRQHLKQERKRDVTSPGGRAVIRVGRTRELNLVNVLHLEGREVV